MENFVEEFIVKLRKENLSQYFELFEHEHLLDKGTLVSITEDDLEKIGVSTLGDRKMIINILRDFNVEINKIQQKSEEAKNDMYLIEFLNNESVKFYKKAFAKYSVYGTDKFAFCWSWASFFFPFLTLLYRKQYLAGLIWFVAQNLINIIFLNMSIPLSQPQKRHIQPERYAKYKPEFIVNFIKI
jgi:hypothetical protein